MANIGRRDAITRTVAACVGAAGAQLLTGCGGDPPPLPPLPPECGPNGDQSLGWAASVVTPVSYGYADYRSVGPSTTPRDYRRNSWAPTNLRVYYPSADGAPQCAPFLTGKYPLVLFLHGQCNAAERHYTKWSHLPAVLARCGYVVAIPDISRLVGYPWENAEDPPLIMDVITWMRMSWSRRANLNSNLGIVGHSYGALRGAQMAQMVKTDAFVSIGGVWGDWPNILPSPLNTLSTPKLLALGTGLTAFKEGVNFATLPVPKHRLTFTNAEHWDYVPAADTTCDDSDGTPAGPCSQVFAIVADLTAIFLSKFMPPSTAVGMIIPDNLMLPTVPLTPEQQSFAGGHLTSVTTPVAPHAGCTPARLDWETATSLGNRFVL